MDVKTIYDLNAILFDAAERINNPELTGQDLQDEKIRVNALKGLGEVMVKNFIVELQACKTAQNLPPNHGLIQEVLPAGFKNNQIKKLEQ